MADTTQIAAFLVRARQLIREHGWLVQGVFDPDGVQPLYLYTTGLTEMGLPELVMTGLCPQDGEVAGAILNNLGVIALSTDLVIGRCYATGLVTDTLAPMQPAFVRIEPVVASDDLWPGTAYQLYGRDRVRLLRAVPLCN